MWTRVPAMNAKLEERDDGRLVLRRGRRATRNRGDYDYDGKRNRDWLAAIAADSRRKEP